MLRGVGGCEFGGEVGEVGEGEFAGVGAVADGEEADGGGDEVASIRFRRERLVAGKSEPVESGAYCMVYLSPSMLAWGSELRFSRRMTILAFDLGSESSASD